MPNSTQVLVRISKNYGATFESGCCYATTTDDPSGGHYYAIRPTLCNSPTSGSIALVYQRKKAKDYAPELGETKYWEIRLTRLTADGANLDPQYHYGQLISVDGDDIEDTWPDVDMLDVNNTWIVWVHGGTQVQARKHTSPNTLGSIVSIDSSSSAIERPRIGMANTGIFGVTYCSRSMGIYYIKFTECVGGAWWDTPQFVYNSGPDTPNYPVISTNNVGAPYHIAYRKSGGTGVKFAIGRMPTDEGYDLMNLPNL
ncbi:MAG: hypothetical protein PHP64_04570, partial [Actinomycetota bacterium]|nr:hypothetical protein [Actinomycetota bacterium]